MKIIAFAGSNSKESINHQLAIYTASLFDKSQTTTLNLNDYEVAIYSVDKEKENGIPDKIMKFASTIDDADLLVISLAEHNGSYTVAFKNIYDWLSRIPNRKVFNNVPVFLLATSPGERGATTVLNSALSRFPRDGSEVLDTFSLPSFYDNFNNKEISTVRNRLDLIRKVNFIKKNTFSQFYRDDSFTCSVNPNRGNCGDAIEY